MRSTITAALAAVVLAAGCSNNGQVELAEPEQTELQVARDDCGASPTDITVGDGGSTLLIDHQGEDETVGASFEDLVCVLAELGVSDSAIAQMGSTSAMDGRQSVSWDGYEASFTYHPDTGMDMIVTQS